MAMKAGLAETRTMMSEREQLTAMRAELAEAKRAEEAVVAPLAAAMRATADEQLQVVVAEAQVMKAQLDEAVAMQGQAEDHVQAELAEARLMKAVLLELTEPRATMAEVAEMQPALAQAQAEVAVVKDVQHDLEEATSAEMARRIEAEVVAMEEAEQAKAQLAEVQAEVVAAQAAPPSDSKAAPKKASKQRT